jgi:hypothetical protein
MKTINTVGCTTVGINVTAYSEYAGRTHAQQLFVAMGWKNIARWQNSSPVVFHMEVNAHTLLLKWGMYLQRRRSVFLFTFVFTET